MKRRHDISPTYHRMVITTYMGHEFLSVYTRGGTFVGLLDFDFTPDELGDWSRLFALGALTLSDLM